MPGPRGSVARPVCNLVFDMPPCVRCGSGTPAADKVMTRHGPLFHKRCFRCKKCGSCGLHVELFYELNEVPDDIFCDSHASEDAIKIDFKLPKSHAQMLALQMLNRWSATEKEEVLHDDWQHRSLVKKQKDVERVKEMEEIDKQIEFQRQLAFERERRMEQERNDMLQRGKIERHFEMQLQKRHLEKKRLTSLRKRDGSDSASETSSIQSGQFYPSVEKEQGQRFKRGDPMYAGKKWTNSERPRSKSDDALAEHFDTDNLSSKQRAGPSDGSHKYRDSKRKQQDNFKERPHSQGFGSSPTRAQKGGSDKRPHSQGYENDQARDKNKQRGHSDGYNDGEDRMVRRTDKSQVQGHQRTGTGGSGKEYWWDTSQDNMEGIDTPPEERKGRGQRPESDVFENRGDNGVNTSTLSREAQIAQMLAEDTLQDEMSFDDVKKQLEADRSKREGKENQQPKQTGRRGQKLSSGSSLGASDSNKQVAGRQKKRYSRGSSSEKPSTPTDSNQRSFPVKTSTPEDHHPSLEKEIGHRYGNGEGGFRGDGYTHQRPGQKGDTPLQANYPEEITATTASISESAPIGRDGHERKSQRYERKPKGEILNGKKEGSNSKEKESRHPQRINGSKKPEEPYETNIDDPYYETNIDDDLTDTTYDPQASLFTDRSSTGPFETDIDQSSDHGVHQSIPKKNGHGSSHKYKSISQPVETDIDALEDEYTHMETNIDDVVETDLDNITQLDHSPGRARKFRGETELQATSERSLLTEIMQEVSNQTPTREENSGYKRRNKKYERKSGSGDNTNINSSGKPGLKSNLSHGMHKEWSKEDVQNLVEKDRQLRHDDEAGSEEESGFYKTEDTGTLLRSPKTQKSSRIEQMKEGEKSQDSSFENIYNSYSIDDEDDDEDHQNYTVIETKNKDRQVKRSTIPGDRGKDTESKKKSGIYKAIGGQKLQDELKQKIRDRSGDTTSEDSFDEGTAIDDYDDETEPGKSDFTAEHIQQRKFPKVYSKIRSIDDDDDDDDDFDDDIEEDEESLRDVVSGLIHEDQPQKTPSGLQSRAPLAGDEIEETNLDDLSYEELVVQPGHGTKTNKNKAYQRKSNPSKSSTPQGETNIDDTNLDASSSNDQSYEEPMPQSGKEAITSKKKTYRRSGPKDSRIGPYVPPHPDETNIDDSDEDQGSEEESDFPLETTPTGAYVRPGTQLKVKAPKLDSEGSIIEMQGQQYTELPDSPGVRRRFRTAGPQSALEAEAMEDVAYPIAVKRRSNVTAEYVQGKDGKQIKKSTVVAYVDDDGVRRNEANPDFQEAILAQLVQQAPDDIARQVGNKALISQFSEDAEMNTDSLASDMEEREERDEMYGSAENSDGQHPQFSFSPQPRHEKLSPQYKGKGLDQFESYRRSLSQTESEDEDEQRQATVDELKRDLERSQMGKKDITAKKVDHSADISGHYAEIMHESYPRQQGKIPVRHDRVEYSQIRHGDGQTHEDSFEDDMEAYEQVGPKQDISRHRRSNSLVDDDEDMEMHHGYMETMDDQEEVQQQGDQLVQVITASHSQDPLVKAFEYFSMAGEESGVYKEDMSLRAFKAMFNECGLYGKHLTDKVVDKAFGKVSSKKRDINLDQMTQIVHEVGNKYRKDHPEVGDDPTAVMFGKIVTFKSSFTEEPAVEPISHEQQRAIEVTEIALANAFVSYCNIDNPQAKLKKETLSWSACKKLFKHCDFLGKHLQMSNVQKAFKIAAGKNREIILDEFKVLVYNVAERYHKDHHNCAQPVEEMLGILAGKYGMGLTESVRGSLSSLATIEGQATLQQHAPMTKEAVPTQSSAPYVGQKRQLNSSLDNILNEDRKYYSESSDNSLDDNLGKGILYTMEGVGSVDESALMAQFEALCNAHNDSDERKTTMTLQTCKNVFFDLNLYGKYLKPTTVEKSFSKVVPKKQKEINLDSFKALIRDVAAKYKKDHPQCEDPEAELLNTVAFNGPVNIPIPANSGTLTTDDPSELYAKVKKTKRSTSRTHKTFQDMGIFDEQKALEEKHKEEEEILYKQFENERLKRIKELEDNLKREFENEKARRKQALDDTLNENFQYESDGPVDQSTPTMKRKHNLSTASTQASDSATKHMTIKLDIEGDETIQIKSGKRASKITVTTSSGDELEDDEISDTEVIYTSDNDQLSPESSKKVKVRVNEASKLATTATGTPNESDERYKKQEEEIMKIIDQLERKERSKVSELVEKQSEEMLRLISRKEKQHNSEQSIPDVIEEIEVLPTGHRKSQLVSRHSFKALDVRVAKVAKGPDHNTYTDLVKEISRNCETDIEKARAIYRWVTVKDLSKMEFGEGIDEDSPLGLLRGIKSGKESYHDLFKRLCSYAGIPVKIIHGFSKGAGYRPGMALDGPTFRNTWTAAYLDGHWYFINCLWASRHVTYRTNDPLKAMYESDDFYFLTNPEDQIYQHWPIDPKFQLLRRPISLEEFVNLPLLRSPFFKNRLVFPQKYKAVLETHMGLAKVKIRTMSLTIFDAILEKADGAFSASELQDRVLVCIEPDEATFTIRPPTHGVYYLHIYVKRDELSHKLDCAASFKINCPVVGNSAKSFPVVPYIGPTPAMHKFGLMVEGPVVHPFDPDDDAIPITLQMQRQVKFAASLQLHDPQKHSLVDMNRHWFLQQKTDGAATFALRCPKLGYYVFSLFSSEADDPSGYLPCIYRCLIESRRDWNRMPPFPVASQHWPNYKLNQPLSGQLKIDSWVLFKIELQAAIDVAVVTPEDTWCHLESDGTPPTQSGMGTWEGVVPTGKTSGRIIMCAKYVPGSNFEPLFEFKLK